MKRLWKIVLALVGLVVILLIATVVIIVVCINSIARKGIEAGGTYALGVDTSLKSASIGLFSGSAEIGGLRVANAPGFPTDHFLTLGDGKVAVKLASLTSDTIYVPEITLSDIDMALEKKDGKANYDVIMGNLQKLGGGGGGSGAKPAPPQQGGPGKKFIIHQLLIRNVNVHADLVGAPGVIGQATKVNVPISEIKLNDVGQTGSGVAGSGVTMGELSGLVVQAIIAAAVEKGGLPADFVNDLKGNLGKLAGFAGGAGKQVADQAQKTIGEIGKQLGPQVQKQAEGVAEGIKGLFGDQKKDEKKK